MSSDDAVDNNIPVNVIADVHVSSINSNYTFYSVVDEESEQLTISDMQQAHMACRSSDTMHGFRIGCTCWSCVLDVFARERMCSWQPTSCDDADK